MLNIKDSQNIKVANDSRHSHANLYHRIRAPIRKSLIYQAIFHPIRSLKKLQEMLETCKMNEDEKYFYLRHKAIFNYKADFKNPKTFNEKIIHRILYDRNPIYTYLADKLKARIYIAHTLQGFTQASIGATRERERERERERAGQSLNLTESKESLRDSKRESDLKQTNQALDSSTLNNSSDSNNQNLQIKDTNNSNHNITNSIDSNLLNTLQKPIDLLESQLFATNTCEFLPKLYGIWDSVDKINFDSLPNAFVLKTNHDCGGVVLVPNKQIFLANKQLFSDSMKKLKEHLTTNYYELFKEYHYKDIEPRVFAEELLLQDNADPTTYKFHCFKGNESHNFIQVTTERFSDNYQRAIMDYAWNLTPFGLGYDNSKVQKIPNMPTTLQAMINLAHILASPFEYVRVDLYNIDCNGAFVPFVGELTFTPMGGTDRFVPLEYDKIFGDLWHIKDLQC